MWWQNNGGPVETWSVSDVARDFANAWPVTTADIDGDGRLEIVSGASGGTEVSWWRLADFVATGTLESSLLQIPGSMVELTVGLDAAISADTDVKLAIRIGASPDELGAWVPIEPDQPLPVMTRGPAYFQYRVELSTDDPEVAPVLRNIGFEWSSELPSRRGGSVRVRP